MAKLTDKQRKKIIAERAEGATLPQLAKKYEVSTTTIARTLKSDPETEKLVNEKKAENARDVLACMEKNKAKVCGIIENYLDYLIDLSHFEKVNPAQLTTVVGTLIDKWTQNTNNGSISPDMAEDNRILAQMFNRGGEDAK